MQRQPPEQPARASFERPEEIEAFDRCIGRFHPGHEGEDLPLGEYFGALLNSPVMCWIASQFGTFVRTAGDRPDTFSHRDREFVDQVLSVDWNTNVVQAVHIPDALATGVRMEAIEALRSGNEDALDDDERLLTAYIRQVVNGTVDDDTYAAMVDRMGTRGVIEYTGFILWLQWILRMMQTLNVHNPSDEEIDQLIAELKETPPDDGWRGRIR